MPGAPSTGTMGRHADNFFPANLNESNGRPAMTEKTGRNRGGKRVGAGRKRLEPWLSHWWLGFKTGNVRIMNEADRMRDEAKAAEAIQPVDKSSMLAGEFGPPVAALDQPESATPAPISAAERVRRHRRRQRLGLDVLRIETDRWQLGPDPTFVSPGAK